MPSIVLCTVFPNLDVLFVAGEVSRGRGRGVGIPPATIVRGELSGRSSAGCVGLVVAVLLADQAQLDCGGECSGGESRDSSSWRRASGRGACNILVKSGGDWIMGVRAWVA